MSRDAFVLGLNPVAIDMAGRDVAAWSEPLVAYLSDALGVPVRVVLEPDYDAQIAAIGDGRLDAAVFGEYAFQRARTEAGAEALAVAVAEGSDTEATYQSVIIAGAETRVYALTDLVGQTVGFVDRGSTAGYLIPRRMLREAGVDPERDITPVFLNSHAAVLTAVARGEVPAGALFRQEVQRAAVADPDRAVGVREVAVSPPVPKGPFAVRRGLNRETRQRLLQALLRIHEDAPEAARRLAAANTRWRPASSRSVTLKTVAALSGVSYGTVSRVINRRAHVAPETYARVMSIVQDLGFRPNAAAVSLIANRSDLVGFVVPHTNVLSIARFVDAAQRALMDEGLHLVLCPTGEDRDEEAHYLGLLDDGRFGGMLLTEWSVDTPLVSTLTATGRPLVLLATGPVRSAIISVAPDVRALGAAAGMYLRTLGHTRIDAFVPRGWTEPVMRGLAGGAGADTVDTTVVHSAMPESAAALMRAALTRANNPPTALVCADERLALTALAVARDMSLAVPERLSVLALADSWMTETATPPLTSIALPLDSLAASAVAALVAQMREEEWAPAPPPAPTLTPRRSTAPPAPA